MLSNLLIIRAGADPWEGGRTRRAIFPPPSLKLGKKYLFAQNRDFSHEIPQKCSRLATLGAIILSAPPNLKSWIRP